MNNPMETGEDIGLKDATRELSDMEKRLTAIVMSIQAAIIQLILEGVFPAEHQIHFMMHLQDFTARLYGGEKLKMPHTNQTLNINSLAGSAFFEAANEALEKGHDNYLEYKRQMTEFVEQQSSQQVSQNKEQDNVSSKPTLH